MFPLTSQVDPVQCAQSQSRKYQLVFLRQTGRNEEQEAVLYAPPTFRQGEERRGDGSIVQPASRWKAPKVNIRLGTMEKTKSGLVRVEQARTSEQSVKTRHRLVWRTLISQSHQVITPGDFPAWQKEGLISRA